MAPARRRCGPRATEATIAAPTGRAGKPRPSTDPGPFRSRSLAPIGWIIATVLIGTAVLLYVTAPDERPVKVRTDGGAGAAIPPPPPPPKVAPTIGRAPVVEPETPNDPLGRASDLKAVYMRYRESRDPIERAIAGRAHRVCFPAFLPPQGQLPSTTYLINALPDVFREERRAAIEALFARCRAFLVPPLDAAEIVGASERTVNGDLATPGAASRWALMRGDRAGAEASVQRALASRDPYAIHSLSGLSTLWMNQGTRGAADPDVTDAALALLACDFGAACGQDSVLALQLCASEGRCQGSARERMVARIGALDAEAVERERQRLRGLIGSGGATIATVWQANR
jgi:hypothetical protein